MTVQRLKDFLEQSKVRYQIIAHTPSVTAQETAQASHIRGKEFAKTVVVKLDGRLAMVVLPATRQVNLGKLQKATGSAHAELADEDDFYNAFPGCEIGAIPPFGNLYGMEVFIADELAEDDEIAFNGGTHTEVLRMAYKDFERLVNPIPIRIRGSLH
ncbi:MAG: YbaK/EbsC family protein [Gammaproteobacteria bacterium]|jgi:Ala-tRNA(Pro) deacylase